MKKIILAALCAASLSACIDRDYDLFDIGPGDIGIGSDASDFRMPLADITVRASALASGGRSIGDLFAEADIWLPSVLPDGSDAADLHLLTSDGSYRTAVVRAMLDEAAADSDKLVGIASLVERSYPSAFAGTVPAGAGVAEFIVGYYADPVYGPAIRASVEKLAADYLSGLRSSLDAVQCDMGCIGADSSVFDMLAGNLGTPDAPDEVNSLSIYGTVESALPVDCRSEVSFVGTAVSMIFDMRCGQKTEIAETRLFESDLRTIFDDARISVPVELDRYYKGRAFPEPEQAAVKIHLSLRRRGAMIIDTIE